MRAIINGNYVLPDGVCSGRALVFDRMIRGFVDEETLPVDVERIDAEGGWVWPGLIDLHIHGYLGADASDGDFAGLRTMAAGIAAHGVTAFLPTTMTVSYPELEAAFAGIGRAMGASAGEDWFGARVLGCNAEGPFLNPAKKGAQAEENIRVGDPAFLRHHADVIRLFTIAPEMPGGMACIRDMAETGLRISLGHTAATYAQAEAAIAAGASHITHLFNAMTPLNHREPGVVGAALTDDRVSCELIADTFHVDKALFGLVARQKGDKLVLITDCLRCGGMSDGEYTLGGQKVYLRGIECRLGDGTIAGSTLTMERAVRNMLENTDLPVHLAVNMGSLNAARVLGLEERKGTLNAGGDADIVLLDRDFRVRRTIVEGRTVYRG